MNTDFENALQQEPVQAILSVIMTYTTQSQRQIIYEKLGRRVAHPPTSTDIVAEAAEKYPYHEVVDPGNQNIYNYNLLKNAERAAHISCAEKYRAINLEMGELLMIKDGEIESLKNDVAELRAQNYRLIKALELYEEAESKKR